MPVMDPFFFSAENVKAACCKNIAVIRMEANTGTKNDNKYSGSTDKMYLRITDTDGNDYDAEITDKKGLGSVVKHDFEKKDFTPPLPDCLSPDMIGKVHLTTKDNDGWLVTSVSTNYSKDGTNFDTLTENPELYKFIDGDQEKNYHYNAKDVILTKTVKFGEECISELLVRAETNSITHSEFRIPNSHGIIFVLQNGSKLEGMPVDTGGALGAKDPSEFCQIINDKVINATDNNYTKIWSHG